MPPKSSINSPFPHIKTKLSGEKARLLSLASSQNAIPAPLDNPATRKQFIAQWLKRHPLSKP